MRITWSEFNDCTRQKSSIVVALLALFALSLHLRLLRSSMAKSPGKTALPYTNDPTAALR